MLRSLRTLLKTNCNVSVATAPLSTTASRLQIVEVQQCDGVREIRLNEPKARNALSLDMMACIRTELSKNVDDEKLRCIVLSSTGPVWSSGHNLKELAKASDNGVEIFSKLTEIIMDIYKLPVPVIAKVNGLAAASGCQLVASCDLVVCSDKSTFSTPGASFGIFCSTPGIAIARVMPRLKSSYMVMTGLPISAQEAYIAGLASVVVPEAELDAELEKITNSIKTKSRAVVALGKRFYYQQLGMPIQDAYTAGAKVMVKNVSLADGQEGLKSFVEKRKPKWSHS